MAGRVARWLFTAAIVVFLVIFARTVDWAAAWKAISSARLEWVLVAFAANAVTLIGRGARWWIFLRPAGARSFWLAQRASIAGAALNNILVAQGGEAARVVFVSRVTTVPGATVLATLVLERMFDVVGFVALLAGATLVFPLPPEMVAWRIPAVLALVAVGALLVWLAMRSRSRRGVDLDDPPAPGHGWVAKFKGFVSWFGRSAVALASFKRFAAALALSLVAWAGQVVTFQWCADATGVEVPLAATVAALLAVNVGFLVRATPGNVGVFQIVYALTVAQFGVARSDAIAISLLIQTLQIIPLTLVGVALAPEFVFKGRWRRAEG